MNKKFNLKRSGIGNRSEECIEVLRREEIEKIIRELSIEKVYKMALKGHIEYINNGYAIMDLRTGELSFKSLSLGEKFYGTDDICITLLKIDLGVEFRMEDYFTIEEMELTEDEIQAYENGEICINEIVEEYFTEDEIRTRIAEYDTDRMSLNMDDIKDEPPVVR